MHSESVREGKTSHLPFMLQSLALFIFIIEQFMFDMYFLINRQIPTWLVFSFLFLFFFLSSFLMNIFIIYLYSSMFCFITKKITHSLYDTLMIYIWAEVPFLCVRFIFLLETDILKLFITNFLNSCYFLY